jgi:hypothetical protein
MADPTITAPRIASMVNRRGAILIGIRRRIPFREAPYSAGAILAER